MTLHLYPALLFDLFGTLVDDAGNALPGAHACLESVKETRWAIVTSCGSRFALALLSHAGLPLPGVLVTSDEVARNKPAPDGYLQAARRLNVDAASALVIEDSTPGIEAGRAAGMDVVAVLRGRSPAFARAATFTISDLTHLRLSASEEGGVLCRFG